MSHKDAPPPTDEQRRMESFYVERKGADFVGFGRDKRGEYLAEYARDAWAAWNAAKVTEAAA